MSAMSESIKHDMHKDLRELEREADSARAELEHTLEELEQRLSPGAMVERVMRVVSHNGGEFGNNLAAQVRNNPLPTVLVSAGLMWLMASSRSAPRPRFDGSTDPSMRDRASSTADSMKHAAHRVTDGARDAAAGVRSTAGAIRDAGSTVAASTRTGAHEIREGWTYMHREHPLVLGALAVAAGAAMGALLPPTEREDEWIGDASDDAKSRVRDEAKRLAGQAREAAADTAEPVRQQADSVRDPNATDERPDARS